MRRWLLLLAIGATVVFYFLLLPGNYQGGGGFVGNRYIVNIYPVFVFLLPLVPRLRWLVTSWVIAGLFLSQIFFTPFGPFTAYPSNQTHTRNWIFRYLPFESTLHSVPHTPYRRWGETVIRFLDFHCSLNPDDSFFVEGEKKAEIMLYHPAPLEDCYFSIVTHANPNTIKMSDWLHSEKLRLYKKDFKPGEAVGGILKFRPSFPFRVHNCFLGPDERTYRAYSITIKTSNGYIPKLVYPGEESRDYWGCRVSFLGKGECLKDEFYRARLLDANLPERFVTGEDTQAEVLVKNESAFTWLNVGPARVNLSYHWLGTDGAVIVKDGLRSRFELPAHPQGDARCLMDIRPPEEPGEYILQIDGLVEHVHWFADKRGTPLYETTVRVEAGEEE
jgi:hypothetical protein